MKHLSLNARAVCLVMIGIIAMAGLAFSSSSPARSIDPGGSAAGTTLEYVSEPGQPATRAPRQPTSQSHASGIPGLDTAATWPNAAGFGLALIGGLMIHTALTLRPISAA